MCVRTWFILRIKTRELKCGCMLYMRKTDRAESGVKADQERQASDGEVRASCEVKHVPRRGAVRADPHTMNSFIIALSPAIHMVPPLKT
jgi:hypothetical protein